ncbi:nitrate reductase [Vibrio cholerae]
MAKECIKSACPYCGVGCGVEISPLGIVGDKAHPANQGALCVKGAALAESMKMPSRLLYPKFQGKEVSWDEAAERIAGAMAEAIHTQGADSVAMYVSGQLLTEDYYVANKLMKGFVGSANIDTNSRLCMSSAVVAHNRAFGEDVVPVNYDDLNHANLIVICGANTAWTHPVLFRRIQQARDKNPEMKLVVIDPRETVTASQADLHIPIDNDGDVALFHGLIRYLHQHDALDHDFITNHTEGFEALLTEVNASQYQLDAIAERINVEPAKIATFYRWFAQERKAITLFCQGVNQSQSGADKGNAIINAHLAKGAIGYQGAGPFSITGQPNAMGGREVGGLANQLAVHCGFDDESIALVEDFWQAPNIARKPGLKAIEMFEAVERNEIKVIWIMATNPVVSMPDNHYVRRALEACPLVIVSDITADSDIAQYADLLLPAAGWGEKQGMVTNSERTMSRQRQFTPPPGQALPDWRAMSVVGALLCEKLGVSNGFDFQSEADVFREYAAMTGINATSPRLLDISQYAELTDEEYRQWQPKQWGGERPYAEQRFSFADGKARFIAAKEGALQRGWWLNTGRQRDQWHTMTRTGHVVHLAASETEPTVYMNALSASHLGIEAGQLIRISPAKLASAQGPHATIVAKVGMDETLSYKQLFMSMHWAAAYGGKSQVNAVVSRDADPHSGQPAFKSSEVELLPVSVKTYGLYIGSQFDPDDCLYHSFQVENRVGIWRFAHDKPADKQTLCVGDRPSRLSHIKTRRVVLDTSSGWLAVDFDEVGDERIVRSLLVTSEQPIHSDYTKLVELVGKALNFSRLISLAAQEGQSELICSCFRVTDDQILQSLSEGECSSVAQLQTRLKCGTNCGSCLPQVARLVEEFEQTQVSPDTTTQSITVVDTSPNATMR